MYLPLALTKALLCYFQTLSIKRVAKICIRTLWPIKLVFDLLLSLIDLFYRYRYLPSILIEKLNN